MTTTVYVTVNGSGTCVVTPPPPPPGSEITTGNGPYGIAFDSASNELFVTNFHDNTVSVISLKTNTTVATIPVGLNPTGIAYDPVNNEIFVADYTSNASTIIDASTFAIVKTIGGLYLPVGVLYVPSNGEIYISNSASPSGNLVNGTVTVINSATNSAVGSILVGGGPWGLALDTRTNQIFVSDHSHWGKCFGDRSFDKQNH